MPRRGRTPPYSLRRLQMDLLNETLKRVGPLNEEFSVAAQKHLDNLTKPPSSLGRIEEFARRLVTITENRSPLLDKKVIFTLAGDHGVVAEGVSAYPKEVTPQMVYNFLRGGAGINVLARHVGARVVIADLGVAVDLDPHPQLIIKKVGLGTANMAQGH